jgi:DNA-binding winged helix-turn-helix (wHTH) protein/Tol biopolymer transport system component
MGSAPSSANRIFRFGQFELSEGERELRKNGVRVKLQEQPFQVLAQLLANAGRIVTREELQQKLWPADTFVDFDVGLNTAVRKIRQAISDDADRPRYIETVAKRGYRFLEPVQQTSEIRTPLPDSALGAKEVKEPEDSPPETVAGQSRHLFPARRRFLGAAVAIVLLLAAAVWQLSRTSPRHLSVEKRITANPSEASIWAAVISPDGKYLAYADPGGMYLRQMDSGETRPVPLPKNFKARPSSWFPDSTHLLVTSRDRSEQKASIWKVSILGGTPQMLLDDAEDGSVSPDGALIAFFHRSPAALYGLRGQAIFHTVGELWLVTSDGQNPYKFATPVDTSDPQAVGSEVTAASWAPNSRQLAYIERHKMIAHSRAGDESWLLTRDLKGGQSQVILRDRLLVPENICWTPDGRVLYTLREDPRVRCCDYGVQAIRINRDTGKAIGESEPVSKGLGWIGGLSVTADGRRLFLWRGNTLPQVYLSEFEPGTHRLTTPHRLTLDEHANGATSWMPDSKSVLFVSDREGVWKLFSQRVDQRTPEVVSGNVGAGGRLSADGSEVLFAKASGTEDPAALVHVMGIPVSGGVPRMVVEDVGIDNFLCARTPATVCVYAKVVRNTTTLISFDTHKGKVREIATFDRWPDWSLSPDGSQVAVVTDRHGGRIQFISLATDRRRDVLVKDWPVLGSASWSADGRSLMVTSLSPDGQSVILDVDMRGNAHVLLESDLHAKIYGVIPSPDGHYLALNLVTGENNVWMVENF